MDVTARARCTEYILVVRVNRPGPDSRLSGDSRLSPQRDDQHPARSGTSARTAQPLHANALPVPLRQGTASQGD